MRSQYHWGLSRCLWNKANVLVNRENNKADFQPIS
jgi:hypothetical protein